MRKNSNNNETITKGNMPLCKGLNQSAQKIFQNNKAKGFWDNEKNIGELLMLVTSELGEAMEAHRKGRFAEVKKFDEALIKSKITNEDPRYSGNISSEIAYANHFKTWIKDTFEDEIADAVIRLLDLSAGLGIDLEKHINMKVRYNESRPKLHGKLY